MTINDNIPVGATQLNHDDLKKLIPAYIVIRDDLNQFEKRNISETLKWLYKKKPNFNQILTTNFCLELHKRMFNKT